MHMSIYINRYVYTFIHAYSYVYIDSRLAVEIIVYLGFSIVIRPVTAQRDNVLDNLPHRD